MDFSPFEAASYTCIGGSKLQFLALQRLEHRQDGLFVELQIVHDDMHHTRRRGLRFEGQEGVNHSAENVLENASKRASACASLLFCFASIFCFLTEPSWPLAEPGWLSSVPECPAWLPEAAICCPRRSSEMPRRAQQLPRAPADVDPQPIGSISHEPKKSILYYSILLLTLYTISTTIL